MRDGTLRRRRQIKNVAALSLATVATGFGLFWLAWILADTLINGFSALNLKLITEMTPPPGSDGGLLNAILRQRRHDCWWRSLLGAPIGILAGTYLAEYRASKRARRGHPLRQRHPALGALDRHRPLRLRALVRPSGHFSGWAGAIALAFILLPVVVRTTDETLRLVPITLREAALALGTPQWKVITKVLYPAPHDRHPHRRPARRRPHQRRDGTAALHRPQQPIFHREPGGADGEHSGRHLPVCARALRCVARARLGRRASHDAFRPLCQRGRTVSAAPAHQLTGSRPVLTPPRAEKATVAPGSRPWASACAHMNISGDRK